MIESLKIIESVPATISFFILLFALILQILSTLMYTKLNNARVRINYINIIEKISFGLIWLSCLLLISYTIIRSIIIQFPAMTNTYEAIILFTQLILLILLIFRIKLGNKLSNIISIGSVLLVILLLAVSSSPLTPSDIKPPIPALRSYWLFLHVSFAFIGEAFFAISFIASIYYIFTKNLEKRKNLDKLIYSSILIGYFLYTTGALIFGAIWGHFAWGRYWGWDPKETWALITFLIYTIYLHLRFIAKCKIKLTVIVSIIGFLAALFTFFGVNFLLSGLHSYG